MFGSAFLVVALAAEPNAAVVLARRTAVAPGEANVLVDKVTTRLGLPAVATTGEVLKRLAALGLKDGTTCNGGADCHLELGKQLKVDWLVLVSVSQIAQDQSLALELFRVAKADVLERESLLLSKRGDVQAAQLEAFSKRVAARMAEKPVAAVTPPVEPPKDAPVVTTVVPTEVPINPVPVAPEPTRSHAGTFVLGGLGIAALGVGVGLLVSGLSVRGQLNLGTPMGGLVYSELSGSTAQQLNDRASVQFGLAGAAGAVGLALLGTGLALW